MVHWPSVVNDTSRDEPVFLLSISLHHRNRSTSSPSRPFHRALNRHSDCSPTIVIPCRPVMGEANASSQVLWHVIEPGAVHRQRARTHHDYGHRRVLFCICGERTFHLMARNADIDNCEQTDIIAVQRVYYNQVYNFSYQWMVVMSTQLVRPLCPPPRTLRLTPT